MDAAVLHASTKSATRSEPRAGPTGCGPARQGSHAAWASSKRRRGGFGERVSGKRSPGVRARYLDLRFGRWAWARPAPPTSPRGSRGSAGREIDDVHAPRRTRRRRQIGRRSRGSRSSLEEQGAPVVRLHAGVCDGRMWRAEVAALAKRRVRAARLTTGAASGHTSARRRGTVVGTSTTRSRSRPRVAGGPGAAILVGCSRGGATRDRHARSRSRPTRLQGLVLVAPAIGGAPEPDGLPRGSRRGLIRVDSHGRRGKRRRTSTSSNNALRRAAWLETAHAASEAASRRRRSDLFLAMNGIRIASGGRGAPATSGRRRPTNRLCARSTCPTSGRGGRLATFHRRGGQLRNHRAGHNRKRAASKNVAFAGTAHHFPTSSSGRVRPLLVEFCRSISERPVKRTDVSPSSWSSGCP
jgi:hypothetical protein